MLLFGSFFVLLLIADQLTKIWAIDLLKGEPAREYLGIFVLTYAENSGGWGSLGADWHPFLRRFTLIFAPLLIFISFGFYLFKNESYDRWSTIGYVCVAAGGVGNIIDRFRFDHVIDFLYMGYGRIGTNIFNIADVAIMVGFFLVLLRSWKLMPKETDSKGAAEPL